VRYLDHNASAPLDPRVAAGMRSLLDEPGANPSSVHRRGQRARAVLEGARRRVAAAVGAQPLEVTFTSGGTEADGLAVLGVARALRRKGQPHGVLTSALEHPAVREAVAVLERDGHPRVLVANDGEGRIHPDAVAQTLGRHPEVGLVTLAAANHELGNAYDVAAIVAAVRELRPDVLVHTDAVQAFGKVPVDFDGWGVDLLSVSAHKVGGPAGIGALVHRRHQVIEPLLAGGHHERGRRPGTENLLGAHGFGIAAELAANERADRHARCRDLRARFLEGLGAVEGARVLGDPDLHVGNTALVAFEDCDGELLMMNLDLAGFAVSTGAACTAGTLEPSPVVLGLGLGESAARSTLRVSVGPGSEEADIDGLLAALPEVVARVRAAREDAGGSR
jgi:cysteine desulfurase